MKGPKVSDDVPFDYGPHARASRDARKANVRRGLRAARVVRGEMPTEGGEVRRRKNEKNEIARRVRAEGLANA